MHRLNKRVSNDFCAMFVVAQQLLFHLLVLLVVPGEDTEMKIERIVDQASSGPPRSSLFGACHAKCK